MVDGKLLKAVTAVNRNRLLPDSDLILGTCSISICLVARWCKSLLRTILPAIDSGCAVTSIRFKRVSAWCKYMLRTDSHPRSRRTSLTWSNFLRPDITRAEKFINFWRREYCDAPQEPYTVMQYRMSDVTRLWTRVKASNEVKHVYSDSIRLKCLCSAGQRRRCGR